MPAAGVNHGRDVLINRRTETDECFRIFRKPGVVLNDQPVVEWSVYERDYNAAKTFIEPIEPGHLKTSWKSPQGVMVNQ